jgi:hypothetical protein
VGPVGHTEVATVRYCLHLVVEGGAVADDFYLGPFESEHSATVKAMSVERRFPEVTALVRILEPASVTLRALEEYTGLTPA